jgi:hypothetical protein
MSDRQFNLIMAMLAAISSQNTSHTWGKAILVIVAVVYLILSLRSKS